MNTATKEKIDTHAGNGEGDPNAPVANSLAAILKFDTVPRARRWMKRWQMWAHFRGMDSGTRRDWLDRAIIEGESRREHKDAQAMVIAECWVTENDELIAVGDLGIEMLGKLPPESFDELWEHVAQLNLLREKDRDALKNSSAGDTGSATSPASPASTA